MFDLGSAVGYLLLDTSGFQSGFKDAEAQMNTFLDKTSTFGDKVNAAGGIMKNVGGTLTKYVTAPLVGAGTAAVKFADDSRSAMNKFQAKVGDVTKEMDNYKKIMEDIYKNDYGEDFEDVADSMANVVSIMGELDDVELQNVTESAIALRDTFDYDVSESVRAVDTLMKNFGLTSEEAFDFIAKGAQEGLDFSGEYIDSINEYSVQFKKLGFTAEETFQIYKTGAESGAWNLDKIGDAIKEFSIRAVDGSDTSIAAFGELGLSFEDMLMDFSAGGDRARDAFDKVIQALKELGEEDPWYQNVVGVELFGTMWEDLGPEVILQMSSITDEAINMQGAMDQLKEVRYDNLGSALEGLGRSFEVAGAQLGEFLIPKVESLIGFVDGLVEGFGSLSPSTQEAIVNFGLIAAAIGPVLLVLGNVLTVLPSIGTALTALTGPVGIVVAAVAGLALAFATNFGGIRDTVMTVMETVGQIIQTALETIKFVWENDLLGIQTYVENVLKYVSDLVEDTFKIIQDLVNIFSDALTGDWESMWQNIQKLAEDVWNAIVHLLGNFLDLIVTTVLGIAVDLIGAFYTIWTGAKNKIEEVWNDIMWWFNQAVHDPVGAVLDIGQALYDAGASIFNMLWDGLSSIWSGISDWVSDKVDWLVDKIRFWENESSKLDTGGRGDGFGRSSGSYASGLSYVPRDMNVTVHEGERILTKQENKEYNGKSRQAQNNYYITFTHAVDTNTAKKVSREIARETERRMREKGYA